MCNDKNSHFELEKEVCHIFTSTHDALMWVEKILNVTDCIFRFDDVSKLFFHWIYLKWDFETVPNYILWLIRSDYKCEWISHKPKVDVTFCVCLVFEFRINVMFDVSGLLEMNIWLDKYSLFTKS